MFANVIVFYLFPSLHYWQCVSPCSFQHVLSRKLMFPRVLDCTKNQYGCFGLQQLHFIDSLPRYLPVCCSNIGDDCLGTPVMYMCGLTAAATSEGKNNMPDFFSCIKQNNSMHAIFQQKNQLFLKKRSNAFLDPKGCFYLIS